MVMASPGVKMPTMRSPGTAPPSDAKRTGRSLLMPRIGMTPPGAPAPRAFYFTDLGALARGAPPVGGGMRGGAHGGGPHPAAPGGGHPVLDRGPRQTRERARQVLI